MITLPNTRKNSSTATESSSTCTNCETSSTSTRFHFWRPATSTMPASSSSSRSSKTSAALASSGVPWQRAASRPGSVSSSTRSISSGSRTSRNATAIAAKSSTASASTPGSRELATIQTSVLMNRKVTNSSSRGSARVTSGNIIPTLRRVRPTAQRAMTRSRSVVPA